MQLKEVLEEYKGEEIEIYKPKFRNNDSHAWSFHTDFIDGVEDYTGEEEVIRTVTMDMEDYDNSVLANTGMNAEEFMDANDKIVCILIEREKQE